MFRRIAVLGTGLIGGSFALAVRRHFPDCRVVGWDRPEVLRQTLSLGVIHEAAAELGAVVREADLVYVALPVGVTLELLPEIAKHAGPQALVTDACSTKAAVCSAAEALFRSGARFLGGHPLAGKEAGGIETAEAELFRGARYALMAGENDADRRVQDFVALVREIGARPVTMDAASHDRAMALLSHAPQLVAVALASEVRAGRIPLELAGSGLRDTLRLAGSPYDIWGEICRTNAENIGAALDGVIAAVERIRGRLGSGALKDDFDAANQLYKALREWH